MKERTIVRYGPFRGYRSSAAPENIGPDEAASGSHDFLFHPSESKWVERKGTTMVQNGITEG